MKIVFVPRIWHDFLRFDPRGNILEVLRVFVPVNAALFDIRAFGPCRDLVWQIARYTKSL